MSAVSVPATAPTETTLDGIAQWCMTIFGQNTAQVQSALYTYINQAQKDWEMEFADHVMLQRSQQLTLTAPIAGVAQDPSYQFLTNAPDFRKERMIRIVAPVNYSRPLVFMEYIQFRSQVPDLALQTVGLPKVWYWSPEDPTGFHVWPCPDQAYTVQFDYIAYAPELLNPTDTPFMDREFHKALGAQALFYLYNSDPVNTPEKGMMWGQYFENEKRKYKKDMQRRQMQDITIPFGTGVNEGRRRTTRPYFFH